MTAPTTSDEIVSFGYSQANIKSLLTSNDTTNTKEALSLCDAAIAKHSNGAEEFHHMSIFNDLYIEALIYLKLNDWQNALSAANNAIEIKKSQDN